MFPVQSIITVLHNIALLPIFHTGSKSATDKIDKGIKNLVLITPGSFVPTFIYTKSVRLGGVLAFINRYFLANFLYLLVKWQKTKAEGYTWFLSAF